MFYRMEYAYVCHRGLVRGSNQDNLLCDGFYLPAEHEGCPLTEGGATSREAHLFAVFDGMGGEEMGEMASYLAADTLNALRGDAGRASLVRAFFESNRRIVRFAEENRLKTCGTTAAVLQFDAGGVTRCNIGDSRIYRIRDGAMRRLSVDDVLPVRRFRKPPLLQFLGIPENEMLLEPQSEQYAAESGDIYLICTDGLTDMLPEERIAFLAAGSPVRPAAESLLEKALEGGGADNITFFLIRIQ